MPGQKRKGGPVFMSSALVARPGDLRIVKRGKYVSARRPARTYATVGRLRRGEGKFFDVGINAAVTFAGSTWADTEVPCDNYINSSGAVAAYTDSCLIPTAVGSSYGQVDGQKYLLKKLRVRGVLAAGAASDQTDVLQPVNVRLMLVVDTQPNGAQAQGEDIIQDVGEAYENLYSFQRVSTQMGRFKVVKDIRTQLPVSGVGQDSLVAATMSVGFHSRQFKISYSPKGGLPVSIKTGNSTPTVAGTVSHNIFLLAAAERAGVSVAVTVVASSRCYYSD